MPLHRPAGRRCLHALGVLATVSAVTAASLVVDAAPASAHPSQGHTVAPGETVWDIADRYDVSVADLTAANDLADPDRIVDGDVLTIPGTSSAGATGDGASSGGAGSGGAGSGGATHRVLPGETLSHLAVRYSSTTAALARLNDLVNPDLVVAGTALRVPGVAATSARPASGGTIEHTVEAGQTLSGIAVRYGVAPAVIVAANSLGDPDVVRAGAQLRIPGAAASTARPTSSAPAASTAASRTPARAEVESLLEDAAARFGWDANLIKALAWQESGWNNAAISSADARGIMQVLPGTNRLVSEPRAGRRLDLSDPRDNVEAGMHYLELLVDLTGGDTEAILAGYYQGVRSVNANGRYPSTERYITNILALRDRFAGR